MPGPAFDISAATSVFADPGFFVTYAAIQAVLLLVLVRLLDPYERQPLGLLALAALWGATGAAFIALLGNEAIGGLLSGQVKDVYGDAVAPPVVEELAKGIALVLLVAGAAWASRRYGTLRLEGVTTGVVLGAAVGLGFDFTEDFFYFVDRTGTAGLEAGADLFLGRRDFFGPTALHHPLFTAAFGALLGLAMWTTNRTLKVVLPLAGLALAVFMHAVNNGLLELVLAARHGLDSAAAWANGEPVPPEVQSTADTMNVLLTVLDYVYIGLFALALVLWRRYQARVLEGNLAEEVELGVVEPDEIALVVHPWRRSRSYWSEVRAGRLQNAQRESRLYRAVAQLGLLKWRLDRFGGDRGLIRAARRRIISLRTARMAGGDLPETRAAVFGREEDLETICAELGKAETRLLTLTGPGGIGKTTLARDVARVLAPRYASGGYFVDLSAISEAERAMGVIANELEIPERSDQPAAATLQQYLHDKQLLLVLDNLEQVIDVAAAMGDLLRSASRLRILATSRVPLRIAGEREYPLGTLEIPAEALGDVSALRDSPAVRLFEDRARAVKPELALADEDVHVVATVCNRLDGLPLAIELAAARSRLFTPGALLERLDHRLDVAAGDAADLPARQRTLRGAIEWSEALLSEEERALLLQMAVFPGGCRIDSALAVQGDAMDEPAITRLLEALVSSSLLRQAPDRNGEPRFSMMEVVREFCLERLAEQGCLSDARARVAAHSLDLAERAGPELEGAGQVEWSERLEADYENLHSALAWFSESGDLSAGVRLVSALGSFWERGHITETRAWLGSALASEAVEARMRTRGQLAAGRFALLQGDHGRAREWLADAVRGFEAEGDELGRARALWELGWAHLLHGDLDQAESSFEASLGGSRQLGREPDVARGLASLGRIVAERGRPGEARPLIEESLSIRRRIGDLRGVPSCLSALARADLIEGDAAGALKRAREALASAQEVGDDLRVAEALHPLMLALLDAGEIKESASTARERLELCERLGDRLGIAECLEALACCACASQAPDQGARLAGAAEALREELGVPAWPADAPRLDRFMSGALTALGAQAFEEALSEGRSAPRVELV